MSVFGVFAVLITATALLAWFNERFLRLPSTIGVMAAALVLSLLLILAGWFGLGAERWAEQLLGAIDFNALLMQGMLSFLLFAGALHVDLNALLERKWSILSLATIGVTLSTLLMGSLFYILARLFDVEILVLEMEPAYFPIIAFTIPLALMVRFVCVGVPISLLKLVRGYPWGTVGLMTWGGVRGGISIALALALPPSPYRDLILVVTYAIVVFSILVQGLSLGRAVRWAMARERS